MKKILVCLLCTCLLYAACLNVGATPPEPETPPEYAMCEIYSNGEFGVTVSEGGLVNISSAEELHAFSAYVNAGGATAGITFRLTATVTLNAGRFNADGFWYELDGITYKEGTPVSFTPVGLSDGAMIPHRFLGTFDGNGYHINGIYIDRTESESGFFAAVGEGAKLLNISLRNGYVSGGGKVGGIVGYALGTPEAPVLINHCMNAGHVTATGDCVGGIAGLTQYTTVVNCSNKNWIKGNIQVGGIVGSALSQTEILTCLNTAVIRGTKAVGGIGGSLTDSKAENCINAGYIAGTERKGAIAGALIASQNTVVGCCYAADTASLGIGDAQADNTAATAPKTEIELKSAALVREMNRYHAESERARDLCHPWSRGDSYPTVGKNATFAIVTAGELSFGAGSMKDAATLAPEGATIKLFNYRESEGGEIAGTFTLDLNCCHLMLSSPLILTGGTITLTDTADTDLPAGMIIAPASDALILRGGTLDIKAGGIVSEAAYAVKNEGTGTLYIPHSPNLQGAGAALYIKYAGTVSGSGPLPPSKPVIHGAYPIIVDCGWELTEGSVIIKNATADQFTFRTQTKGYNIIEADGNLVAVSSEPSLAVIIGICFAALAVGMLATFFIVKKLRSSAK